jgi:hypothetical protein
MSTRALEILWAEEVFPEAEARFEHLLHQVEPVARALGCDIAIVQWDEHPVARDAGAIRVTVDSNAFVLRITLTPEWGRSSEEMQRYQLIQALIRTQVRIALQPAKELGINLLGGIRKARSRDERWWSDCEARIVRHLVSEVERITIRLAHSTTG